VRIQETVRWFGVGLSPLLGATRTTTTTRNRNSNHDNSNIREWVENALVDCLWLLGATLTSLEWKAPPLAGAADARALPSPAALNFHPSVRALIVIVRALLASPFFCRSSSSSSGISSSSGVEHGATNDGTAVPVNEDSDKTSSFSSSSSSGLARKLQKNWFPVLLEAVDAIRVVAVAAAAASSSSNNSNSNARALPPGTTNDLMKRLRQYNTAANYRQQKYSLLQEDSEGYSKLLQHLCSGGVGVGVGVGVGNSGGSTRTGNTHSSGGVVSRNSNTASTSNTNATTTTTTTDSSATDIVVSDVDNNINNDNNHHPNNNGRGARS